MLLSMQHGVKELVTNNYFPVVYSFTTFRTAINVPPFTHLTK